jgi:hypothetical protein
LIPAGSQIRSPYVQSKRVENLHLTRERDRRRGRELARFLVAGLPIAFGLLAYAALHIETVRVGYAREAREKRVAALVEENRRFRAELARASSPERVAAVANLKKLRPPGPGQIQYVEPSSRDPQFSPPNREKGSP